MSYRTRHLKPGDYIYDTENIGEYRPDLPRDLWIVTSATKTADHQMALSFESATRPGVTFATVVSQDIGIPAPLQDEGQAPLDESAEWARKERAAHEAGLPLDTYFKDE